MHAHSGERLAEEWDRRGILIAVAGIRYDAPS